MNELMRRQYASQAGFYVDFEYQRGIKFVSWLTNLTHTVKEFRNVGMIGLVNEPGQNLGLVKSMINDYYPEAYAVNINLILLSSTGN